MRRIPPLYTSTRIFLLATLVTACVMLSSGSTGQELRVKSFGNLRGGKASAPKVYIKGAGKDSTLSSKPPVQIFTHDIYLANHDMDATNAQDPAEKYRDVTALPMEKRRSAFSNLPAKMKSDLVRTHLALYLARHSRTKRRPENDHFGGYLFDHT